MKLTCRNCGWSGYASETGVRYFSDPHSPDDVVPEMTCPECGSELLEEYADQS